jgi:hypothetical protein
MGEDYDDWGVQNEDENEYLTNIKNQITQDIVSNTKKGMADGAISGAALALVNANSVKLFTTSKFYKEALYAQKYL